VRGIGKFAEEGRLSKRDCISHRKQKDTEVTEGEGPGRDSQVGTGRGSFNITFASQERTAKENESMTT